MDICAKINFTILRDIGAEGKNSDVYIAHDHQLDADIVVKKLEKSQFADHALYYDEAKKLYYSRHRNIVEIKYACSDKKYIYLAMPFYDNGSVNSLINKRFLSVREIIKYSIDFLSGLHNIHTKGLMHFDIKPTNILLDNSNRAMLTDFGLAKYLNNYGYASFDKIYGKHHTPESFLQSVFTITSDIYQAGLTLYRMCNGNEIFNSQYSAIPKGKIGEYIINGNFPDRHLYLPHIPKKLRQAINKCLEVDSSKRYNTALELINVLGSIDTCLDWVYNEDRNTCSYSWQLECETHNKYIRIYPTNSEWQIYAEKIMKGSGNRLKINDYVKNNIKSFNEAISIVERAIKELSV